MLKLENFLKSESVHFGFCEICEKFRVENYENLNFAISIYLPLSRTIISRIEKSPTFEYFHHYRTVNASLDRIALKVVQILEEEGFDALPIGASQSVDGCYRGIFSHKMAGRLSGLGFIGKNDLFTTEKFGSAVRLVTILTNKPLQTLYPIMENKCGDCLLCEVNCPSGSISGVWSENYDRDTMFDAEKCSNFMKKEYIKIGRGVVCGRCIYVCPFTRKYLDNK